jgi:hypothetical protein
MSGDFTKDTKMKRIFSICFILLLMAFTSIAQKNIADTSKWNGVWDPTDPKCPCYDIQKQAEKEYQEMLRKDKKKEAEANKNYTDSTIVNEKKSVSDSLIADDNQSIKNNHANNAVGKNNVKFKANKKRKKSRERKYKRGKAVCPEV